MKVSLDLDQPDLESMLSTKYCEQIVKQLVWTVGSYDCRVGGGEKKYYLSIQISRVRDTYLWKDLTTQTRTYDPANRFNIYNDPNIVSGVFHSWDELVSWCVKNNIRFDTKIKLCEDQYGTIFFKKDGVAFGPQFPDETQAAHWMSDQEPWLPEGGDPLGAYQQAMLSGPKVTHIKLFAMAFHTKEETWEELLHADNLSLL